MFCTLCSASLYTTKLCAVTLGEVEGFEPQPRLSVTSKNNLHSDTNCLFTSISLSLFKPVLCHQHSTLFSQELLDPPSTAALHSEQRNQTGPNTVGFESLELLIPPTWTWTWTLSSGTSTRISPFVAQTFWGETQNQISSPSVWNRRNTHQRWGERVE